MYNRLKSGACVYLPYLGKNEFPAWWDKGSVKEYNYSAFTAAADFRISSLFVREHPLLHQKIRPKFSPALGAMTNASSFMYFERLPLGFDETLLQYELAEFAFTDWVLKEDSKMENLLQIVAEDESKVIQLF